MENEKCFGLNRDGPLQSSDAVAARERIVADMMAELAETQRKIADLRAAVAKHRKTTQ